MCRFCEPVDKSSLLVIKEENYPINIRKDKFKQALYLDTMSGKPEYIYSTDVGPLTLGDLHIEANFCMYCGRKLREQLGNCETSYARSAILIENKKRIRLAHESLDEKVNQLILGAL